MPSEVEILKRVGSFPFNKFLIIGSWITSKLLFNDFFIIQKGYELFEQQVKQKIEIINKILCIINV